LNSKKTLIYYLALSFFAIIFLLIIAYLGSNQANSIKFSDKIIIGALFIISCLLGMSLAQYPGWYKKIYHKKQRNMTSEDTINKKRKIIGHHPDCLNFSHHIIWIKKKANCAGCLGLTIGSLTTILLMVLYIFSPYSTSLIISYSLFYGGLLFTLLSFIEIIFSFKYVIIHVLLNALFIIGFFFLSISLYEITVNINNTIIGLFFSFLFIKARMQVSQWKHTLICSNCIETCKMY